MFGEDTLYHYGPLVVSGIALIVALTPHLDFPHSYATESREWVNGQEWAVSRCRWCKRIRRDQVGG